MFCQSMSSCGGPIRIISPSGKIVIMDEANRIIIDAKSLLFPKPTGSWKPPRRQQYFGFFKYSFPVESMGFVTFSESDNTSLFASELAIDSMKCSSRLLGDVCSRIASITSSSSLFTELAQGAPTNRFGHYVLGIAVNNSSMASTVCFASSIVL